MSFQNCPLRVELTLYVEKVCDFLVQVVNQQLPKTIDQMLELFPAITTRCCGGVFSEVFYPRLKGLVLLQILVHDSLLTQCLLYTQKEHLFFDVMVVVDNLNPNLAESEKVFDFRWGRHSLGLQIDGVQTTNVDVV